MAKHRTRIGVNGRNSLYWTGSDFELVRRARIETLKMMSHTSVDVFERVRQENPNLEFIIRLYDTRMSQGSRPTPAQFVAKMVPLINKLKPYATKFEIHNEPNHASGIEGWGPSDAQARAFASWYSEVLPALRQACPWARFGFPGLALNHPHRDLEWIEICRAAITASDFLGCHCYWQGGNMMSDDWGLRFKLYHQRFPDMAIEVTEFGNSTPDLPREQIARQYMDYYRELNRYLYLGSASAFIASSPDPAWSTFVWMKESGEMLPVVDAVGSVDRRPVEVIVERTFPQTGKTVRGAFLEYFDKLGLAVCGYPITDQFKLSGIPTQYFRRVAIEEHKPGQLRLRAVGDEALKAKVKIRDLTLLIDKLSQEPLTSVEAVIEQLSDLVSSLATQIQALQEVVTTLMGPSDASGAPPSKVATNLEKQVKALQKASDSLHAEMAVALKAMGAEQTAVLEYLRARVIVLAREADRLQEQLAPSLPGASGMLVSKPDIEYLVDKLPRHPTETFDQRPMDAIKTVVIHHSAGPTSVGAESIAKYHIERWDWAGIGYHFLVTANGRLQQTNDLETVSSHAASVNPISIGVCFLGNFTDDVPPRVQLEAGAHLVSWLTQELGLDVDSVKGHKEYMQTACPGKQWLSEQTWKLMLQEAMAAVQLGVAQPSVSEQPRTLYHYMLFPSGKEPLSQEEWEAARKYVGVFLPTLGFKPSEAVRAEAVTIVGGTSRVSQRVEDWLAGRGCKVDRIGGKDLSEIKKALDALAAEGRRFLAFEE